MSDRLSLVLKEFLGIAQIPRPSHHEEKIAAYLISWAKERRITCYQDELGQVIMEKEASPGAEKAPRVILQAHMDMVCVAKEGVSYNPMEDPIHVLNDGIALTADGTSLGADDGIGVALALYLLTDETLYHGPLKALFTVNEEDGMSSGAMDSKYLNAEYLINLDWEWLGSLCNSSAGGDFLSLARSLQRETPSADSKGLQITLSGLLGGHSGVDIHRGRGNAISIMAAMLCNLRPLPWKLADFHGGQARNAIPAGASAVLSIPPENFDEVQSTIQGFCEDIRTYFSEIEPHLTVEIQEISRPENCLKESDTRALIDLLLSIPNGVHTMSPYVPTLVESSENVGLLSMDQTSVEISAMIRSCTDYRAKELLRCCELLADAYDFIMVRGEHSPAWAVNPKSVLTPLTCEIYKELTGNDMVVEPVHGALECGAFFEKNPNLDMIAIGPSLLNVHTPKESCDLESVRVTAELLDALLRKLAL